MISKKQEFGGNIDAKLRGKPKDLNKELLKVLCTKDFERNTHVCFVSQNLYCFFGEITFVVRSNHI